MFIVLLNFSTNKPQAGQFMEAHKDWLNRGFDDGVFLLSGSLLPQQGGAIFAHDISREALERRVKDDPFVVADVVSPSILEIDPSKADPRLAFLID